MNFRTASLLAIAPLFFAHSAIAQRTDLYLLIGQSNMAGRGTVEAQDREPIPGVFALTKANTWVPAVDPLHWDKPQIAGVGLGRSFAKKMREVEPDVNIGLIPAAFGGTSLEEWAVGGNLYKDAVERTRTALRLAGPGAKLKGMLWHQGEAECGKEALANTYIERWSVIIAALKKDLNVPEVPVIVGQLGTFLEPAKSPFAGTVNDQLKAIPSRIPNTAFVSSEGLKDKGDLVHFNTEGARELGRRYAAALLGLTSMKGHDFFYAGEQKEHWMFVVRGGKIVWEYKDAGSKGEISDAVMLSNGNILFAHQYGIKLISPDKKLLWNYDAPAGTEVHTAQPIGLDRVVFVQNGDPALCRVINLRTNKIEREFVLAVGNPKSVHGHFRHARLTPAGTLLVAHMDNKKVVEYDSKGKEVWSVAVESPWSAVRLENGNTLITTNKKLVREVNPKGETVWEAAEKDLGDWKVAGFQIAQRLPNGNTLVNNWVNVWSVKVDASTAPFQAVELTPEKKVVWVLRNWDLGPATTLQLLDTKTVPERAHFGEFK